MKNLRIIGVPEHFNYAFRLLAEEQPFLSDGLKISWHEESRGSGQMIQELKNGNAEMGILLTESFLKEAESNPDIKLIGFYVQSPLIWGIHVGTSVKVENPSDLPTPHFLVSRMGSGSQLMAKVLANSLTVPWSEETFYEIIGNLDGAVKAMEKGSQGIFLWEKYTTSPTVKSGKMKRIGELPSPWPCFVIAVNKQTFEDYGDLLILVRNWIYEKNKSLKSNLDFPKLLANSYQLNLEEVNAWLSQTQWTENAEKLEDELKESIDQVYRLGIIQSRKDPSQYILK